MRIRAGDLKEGRQLAGNHKSVTLKRMRGFSGWPSRNIHTDEAFAKACGLPGPIASATMYEAYLVELMLNIFGEDWIRHGRLELAFVKMVHPSDTLAAKAIAREVGTAEAGRRVSLEVWCENQRGERVAVGSASGRVTG